MSEDYTKQVANERLESQDCNILGLRMKAQLIEIDVEAMKAENDWRKSEGKSPAYREEDFHARGEELQELISQVQMLAARSNMI